MKAESITFQAGTKYTCFMVLKFSQKQKFYPYPYKKSRKRAFWGEKSELFIILSYIMIVFILNMWDVSHTIKLAPKIAMVAVFMEKNLKNGKFSILQIFT